LLLVTCTALSMCEISFSIKVMLWSSLWQHTTTGHVCHLGGVELSSKPVSLQPVITPYLCQWRWAPYTHRGCFGARPLLLRSESDRRGSLLYLSPLPVFFLRVTSAHNLYVDSLGLLCFSHCQAHLMTARSSLTCLAFGAIVYAGSTQPCCLRQSDMSYSS
jgi:hypothetical protein